MKMCCVILILLVSNLKSQGQNNRISEKENIGWYNFFGTLKLSDKIGIHSEYQWRRTNYVTDWQQSLLRVGVNYNFSSKIQIRTGYAWVKTFPYGEIPINKFGKSFSEHRIFQMIQMSNSEGNLMFTHRLMLEQRFIGSYRNIQDIRECDYIFQNRARYMLRLMLPIKDKIANNKFPYLSFYDEIFIGFGKNVNANVFDQNRIGVLFGYKFNENISIEGGYLNQILELGRMIDNKNVFQYNNGIICNAIFKFDATK